MGTGLRGFLVPLGYKARRAMGRKARTLEQAASRSWVVAEGREEEALPIYVPEGHFERIRRGSNGETPEEMRRLIRPAKHVAAPTMAYLLRDVMLVGGALYAGMFKEDLFGCVGKGEWREAEIESGVFAATYASARWFAHFMHDELPLQVLARRMGNAVMHRRQEYGHEPGWRKALGIAAPEAYDVMYARELVLLRDFAQNPSKRERCAELRSKLAELPKGAERVYLKRDGRGADPRILVNEEAVISRLKREGFVVVEPMKLSVEEILRACMGARVVVSVEGSHTACALYCATEGARVLYLNPPYRVSVLEPSICFSYGLRGGIFVCEAGEKESEFSAGPEEVVRAVESWERVGADGAQEKARIMV